MRAPRPGPEPSVVFLYNQFVLLSALPVHPADPGEPDIRSAPAIGGDPLGTGGRRSQ
ncbi:hypothetical protein AB205_0201630 [Aquarana catesbeiana]|uniref:Uncharacterized protein n=1 Tax=Aquarana catesbeiana TaxID=8400 RepID=A0A2G9SNP4_AQUCT|nr:hypothetical protein AB205_0201630 [Aquarana catesbeiana]